MFTKMTNFVDRVVLFVCFCILSCAAALKEGDSCLVSKGVLGSCRNVTDCAYADQLIRVDIVKPPHCAWHRSSDEEVVCCPLDNNLHKTGQYRAAFGDTIDGVLRSFNMVCRYDGRLPITCCEDKHNDTPEPEPKQCPKLPRARKEIEHVAWEKCVEFQRYANVCEHREDGSYDRRNACVMSNLANKISGGVPALQKEFPHMALLGCRNDADPDGGIKWIAGGTLISDRFVLTAAHVVSHRDYGIIRYALLGTLSKSSAREGILHNVVRYEKHKFYKATEKYYDIALLELDSRVIFSDFIRPACLALPGMDLSDERILAGWGETGGAGGSPSDQLLKAVITEFDLSRCSRLIDPQGLPRGWDAAGMICAGSEKGGTVDSCHGDSGGPLMAYMKDLPCSYAVRGIVSWGPQCGQGAPGVYTNVNQYLDWIVERVWPSFTIR